MQLRATVSVVIITHNRRDLAFEALASAAGQTMRPCEIILVDDGSEPPVETNFADRSTLPADVPIRLVRLEDLGPSAARNAGAAQAIGDFLALLDDDDLWEPDYLRRAIASLHDRPAQCVITWLTCFDGQRRWRGKEIPSELNQLDLFSRNPGVVGSNIVIERSAFQKVGGFDAELLGSEDKDFLIRLLGAGIEVTVQTSPLVLYRVHAESQASGQGSFHYLQVSGKARFLRKHADAMSAPTRRRLAGESGYFCLMGGDNLPIRIRGLWSVLTCDPLLILRRIWAYLRRQLAIVS